MGGVIYQKRFFHNVGTPLPGCPGYAPGNSRTPGDGCPYRNHRVGAALAAAHPDMHVGDRDDREGRPYV